MERGGEKERGRTGRVVGKKRFSQSASAMAL
jgi:hypothetical protein